MPISVRADAGISRDWNAQRGHDKKVFTLAGSTLDLDRVQNHIEDACMDYLRLNKYYMGTKQVIKKNTKKKCD